MAKGKPKSKRATSVKAAVGTAALLASGASAKGLRESGAGNEEVVVASAHISSKQGLNDDPPPNLTVMEKVIAETAPFQMIRQMRSMEDAKAADETEGAVGDGADEERELKTGKKKKSKKEKKEKKSKKKKVRQLGMEPPEADDSDSNEDELKVKEKKRFRWI
eukprot:scaffold2572_cov75-Skeletonema_marinoi.AAC.21